MDNHELRYNGTIATRHLGQLVAPGQSVLVSAHHAVSMHGQRGWECADLKKAKQEVSQKAKAVSTQSNVNIDNVDTKIAAVSVESAPIAPGEQEQPLVNAAATDTVVNIDNATLAAETDNAVDASVDTNKIPCTKCEQKFPSKRKLQIHLNSAHTDNASTSLV